jgi:hypothetical protein
VIIIPGGQYENDYENWIGGHLDWSLLGFVWLRDGLREEITKLPEEGACTRKAERARNAGSEAAAASEG